MRGQGPHPRSPAVPPRLPEAPVQNRDQIASLSPGLFLQFEVAPTRQSASSTDPSLLSFRHRLQLRSLAAYVHLTANSPVLGNCCYATTLRPYSLSYRKSVVMTLKFWSQRNLS